jgi:hypothetical protein
MKTPSLRQFKTPSLKHITICLEYKHKHSISSCKSLHPDREREIDREREGGREGEMERKK